MMNQIPLKPKESECCGSGCKPCVFDIYEEKLKKWKTEKSSIVESKVLNQLKYLPFLIISIEEVTEFVKIFKFQAVTTKTPSDSDILIENALLKTDYDILQEYINIKSGEYLIMKGKYDTPEETIKISRPYTPISRKAEHENGIFTVIISLAPHGKMSQFIAKLAISDIVFWRGPYKEFDYHRNTFERILLIGGGTGVVPLYNISKAIVEDDKDDTQLNFMCAFKTVKHILLRKELSQLKDYWNFQVRIFISNQEEMNFKPNYNESVTFERIEESMVLAEVRKYEKNNLLAIISGPDSFNKCMKNYLLKFGLDSKNIFIFW